MKTTNTTFRILAVLAIFLNSNYLIAQTNTSPTQTVCAGSIAEPYLINPPSSGSTYQWSLTGGGTLNPGTTTDNITIDWGVTPGTYTVSVVETDMHGCQGNPVTVDVTVLPLPTATIATSQTACFGSTIPPLTAIGANVNWYSDAGLTNQVGSGNTFYSPNTTVGIYTYYVTETLNGCEGPSVSVTLEIYNSASAPSAIDEVACEGSVIPPLTATGSNLTWYSDAALTNNVGTGNSFSTSNTAVGVYTYYVTENNANGCQSAATPVTLEIYNSATAPSTIDEVACEGSVIPPLTATGSNLTWYFDAALTNNVGTGNSFSTSNTAVGVYTYYVTENNSNGCESVATPVTLTINATPLAPSASNENACFGGSIPFLTATGSGSTFNWYDDISLSNLVSSTNPFNTGQTNPGIYTYYVTETLNGCQSSSLPVTLEIYTTPNTGPINHW